MLVTYDCQTVPPLLKEWVETGVHHGGVVLIDEETIGQSDVGGLLRALNVLIGRGGGEDWTDRVVFLKAG